MPESNRIVWLTLLVLLPMVGCQTEQQPALNLSEEFGDYWFQGEAELTSYQLEQARYGEVHPGEAVLIFVTEDFSGSKQVKLDNPQSAGNDAYKVLKLNATKKFYTGVYPYSMMASVFTPLQFSPASTLKITASSQEWCGHTFAQLNNRDDQFEISLKSYFESEGDQEFAVSRTLLEDEVWTTIRIDPAQLPTGNFEMIPSLLYARLSHRPSQAEPATGRVIEGDSLTRYELDYPAIGRRLSIDFRSAFPHEIHGWEETSNSRGEQLTTRATLAKRINLDYWSRNSLADSVWRDALLVR